MLPNSVIMRNRSPS